ncbi:MAG: hypothetical protein E6J59_09765 [Deltaproteobacteria bacterium]|nr:MAG: hypothetical protein E6J59_09765 [Deltaproteobacteria bacterium]
MGALVGCGPELHALEQSLRPFHPVPNENERYELQGVSVLPPQGPWRFAFARGNESGSWLDPADGDHVARKHANLLKFARMASTDYRRAGAFILIRRPSIVGADMVALHARVEQGVRAEIRDRLQYERAEADVSVDRSLGRPCVRVVFHTMDRPSWPTVRKVRRGTTFWCPALTATSRFVQIGFFDEFPPGAEPLPIEEEVGRFLGSFAASAS